MNAVLTITRETSGSYNNKTEAPVLVVDVPEPILLKLIADIATTINDYKKTEAQEP
jgi:hypothetical protein